MCSYGIDYFGHDFITQQNTHFPFRTCTSAAFQVVTRALIFDMNHKLIGKVLIYVDDIMGVCLRKDSNLFNYNGGHGQSQNHMHRPPGPNRRRYRDNNVV